MNQPNWQRSIEQIVLTATNQRNRVLGLTSLNRGAGVSMICRHLARTFASSGNSALLIDMSWAQATSGIAVAASSAMFRETIVSSGHGYDVLSVGGEGAGSAVFGNLPRFREMLRTDFADYDRFVIDMPPILETAEAGFSTVAAAAMCDRLMLVCAVGVDKRSEVSSVVSMLKGAGVALSGIISNEYARVDAREQLAKLGLLRPQV